MIRHEDPLPLGAKPIYDMDGRRAFVITPSGGVQIHDPGANPSRGSTVEVPLFAMTPKEQAKFEDMLIKSYGPFDMMKIPVGVESRGIVAFRE